MKDKIRCENCLHNKVCYWQEVTNNITAHLEEFGCDDYKPITDIKTEVAKEIFAEIEELLFDYENVIREEYRNAFETRFAELKNKYIGGVGE